MTRSDALSDEAWARIEPLLPPEKGLMGRPSRPHRPVVEGMIYRSRTGIPWRDLPAQFNAWQSVHRRFQRRSTDGTLDGVLADADAAGELEWAVSVNSTIARAHQHGTCVARSNEGPSSHTGGDTE